MRWLECNFCGTDNLVLGQDDLRECIICHRRLDYVPKSQFLVDTPCCSTIDRQNKTDKVLKCFECGQIYLTDVADPQTRIYGLEVTIAQTAGDFQMTQQSMTEDDPELEELNSLLRESVEKTRKRLKERTQNARSTEELSRLQRSVDKLSEVSRLCQKVRHVASCPLSPPIAPTSSLGRRTASP